ncbi:MAG: antirepressor regulating drug resistance protein [Phycisphaerales bacterium]|nr:antirepressor regulating drug resistance protein [Phycisphaerales bacterium]
MESLLWIAISNAIVAGVAAPFVWAISRFARRPALTHALWLVVLLKLVTPPVWTIPVHVVPRESAAKRAVIAPPVHEIPLAVSRGAEREPVTQADTNPPTAPETPFEPLTPEAPADVATPIATSPPIAPAADALPPKTQPAAHVPFRVPWRLVWPALAGVWVIGSLVCLVVTSVRIVRFGKVLRFAVPAPMSLQQQARMLARRLGLGNCPTVWLVPGAMCPMLWAGGTRARVLVPRGLWEILDDAQRDTLLLHELAHLRRRDHWVRWIELVATMLYWWHPGCWWARQGLREAEEQCCDAWVLWAQPGAFRSYATALLTTVEYVSVRQPVPMLASGMGQFHLLKARLTMLKKGDVSRALTWGGFSAACGIGAILLSIAPTLAQSAPEQPESTPPAAEKPATEPPTPAAQEDAALPPATAQENGAPAAEPVRTQIDVTTTSIAPTVEAAKPESQQGNIGAAPVGIAPPVMPAPTPAALPPVPAPPPPAGPGENARDQQFRADMAAVQARNGSQNEEVAHLQRTIEKLSSELAKANARLAQLQYEKAGQAFNRAYANNANGQWAKPNPYGYDARPGAVVSPPATADERDRRLDKLEKTLAALLDEVRTMRQTSPDASPKVPQNFQPTQQVR